MSLERGQAREGKSQARNYGRVRVGERERERDIHGVIRFLANYSRVPLTSPICLDYERRARPSSLRPSSPTRFKALLSRRCSTRFLLSSFFVSFFSYRPLDIVSCRETTDRTDRSCVVNFSSIFFSSSSFNPIRHGIRIDLYAVQIGFIRARFLAIYPIAGYDNKLEILWNYNVTITSLADFNFDKGGDVKGMRNNCEVYWVATKLC